MKKIIAIILAVVAVIGIVGCQKSEETKTDITLNVQEAGNKLLDGVNFEIKPEQLPADAISYFATEQFKIDLGKVASKDNVPEMFVAVTASAPESVVVVAAKDEASAKAISEGAIKEWLEYNTNGFKDYGPQHVPKLESAVNTVKGRYVFYVVSGDNAKAASLIDEIVKAAGK